MDWLRDLLRRWLKVPAVLNYVPADLGAEVCSAVTYQDAVYIFTRRGQVYKMKNIGEPHGEVFMKLIVELPR